MENTEQLQKELRNFHDLKLEAENIQSKLDECKTRINEQLITIGLDEFEGDTGVTVKKFTPNAANRLNKGLIESYCNDNNVDIENFYKKSIAKEQIRILIPETREKIKAFLHN